jgi:hypothetical protein
MVLKLIALHPKQYVRDYYNCFDAVVVVLSMVDLVISITLEVNENSFAAEAISAFRAMRLLRVIKIMRHWAELQSILRKIYDSIVDISSFSLLLFLFIYILALLGMELFANYCKFDEKDEMITDIPAAYKEKKFMISPRENFDTLWNGITTVFIIIVGEDWPGVMFNYVRMEEKEVGKLTGYWNIIYFFFVFVLGNLLLLSLFTAILLQNFESTESEK